MKLSSCVNDRDNNFNLIRITAALAVLITHSFVLCGGFGTTEPLAETLGMTLGVISVDAFFLISGFLVTASILKRQSVIDFVWARVLRIFPALIVMVSLTVFLLGPLLTTQTLSAYFGSEETWIYFIKCSTLIANVEFTLPGVFENNPFRSGVNGSLWTMPTELRLYITLAVLWLLLQFTPSTRPTLFKKLVTALAIITCIGTLTLHFAIPLHEKSTIRQSFMFFTGATFYIFKERITLSPRLFFGALAVMAIAIAVDKEAFYIAYLFSIGYVLFFIAFIPGGAIRAYNRLGDYSYGVYIYAFPVQQILIEQIPGISVLQMTLLAIAITLGLAFLSWHYLERFALQLKPTFTHRTRQWLAISPSQ